MIAVAGAMALGQVAGAADNTAQQLFYEPGDGSSKALFGSGRGARISPESPPGQEYTTENIGGLGGITDYYEKLDNPGVMYYIELVQQGSSNVKRVSSSRVFRSGDRIRIHITTNGDGYLHAVHRGSTGASKLLPVSTGGRVVIGNAVAIPSDGGWLRFDHRKGIEKVDLLFSSHPNAAAGGLIPTSRNPAILASVESSIERYGASKSLVSYEQGGEKDLVVEGGAAAGSPLRINRTGAPGYSPGPELLAAPGSYAVNTAGEPVVVKIRLKHQ